MPISVETLSSIAWHMRMMQLTQGGTDLQFFGAQFCQIGIFLAI